MYETKIAFPISGQLGPTCCWNFRRELTNGDTPFVSRLSLAFALAVCGHLLGHTDCRVPGPRYSASGPTSRKCVLVR